jgi:hypothetical protein
MKFASSDPNSGAAVVARCSVASHKRVYIETANQNLVQIRKRPRAALEWWFEIAIVHADNLPTVALDRNARSSEWTLPIIWARIIPPATCLDRSSMFFCFNCLHKSPKVYYRMGLEGASQLE